ncbi:MAG: phosphonopyruvate decarboxylase [Gammaproteobacteria bacterium]|nr:phosphonopyruvate decarboxylase [Gammaproteobacteria bacterium]
MIEANTFVTAAKERGFGLFAGVPCSYLTPFINHVISDENVRYVVAANEGDAVAIAAGAELGGTRAIAMFQNSGLGNAVSPLTSLTYVFQIPVLVITTLRGEPGGATDEPQHALMGKITTGLLEMMQIPWEYFPTEEALIASTLDRALTYMNRTRRPYALVMRKGTVRPSPLNARLETKPLLQQTFARAQATHKRFDFLQSIQSQLRRGDSVIATTGYTGRELFACSDRSNQLYMVGSMGCASSLGLGVALARPKNRIIVIDGDGAALMRLGAMTTIGYERPPNMVHILLDNHVHESTGSQSTVSQSIDFCALAAACGYPRVARIADPGDLADALTQAPAELSFYHVPTVPGVNENLGRPTVTPAEVAERFRNYSEPDR